MLAYDVYAQTHSNASGWPSIQGRVMDSNGTPIAGVTVLSNAGGTKSVRTDDAGGFTFNEPATMISFRKQGFRPSSVVIVNSREPLQVVLELVAPTEWRIPRCPPSTHSNSLGFDFRLTLPSSMKTEAKGCSVDACLFEIHFTEQTGTTSTMWVTVGSAIGTDDDTPRVDGAATITERHLVSRGDKGIDSRGTLHNGRLWRDVTSWYGAARYTDASAETAAAFDRVIDTACYPDPEDD